MNRLETLRQYLAEAEQHPLANRLYIEDLQDSIKYEEKYRFSSGFKVDKEKEDV